MEVKSAEERKALLARAIDKQVSRGGRIESRSDFEAIVIHGALVRPSLDLLLSFLQMLAMLFNSSGSMFELGERRVTIKVDEHGKIDIEK